MSSGPIFITVWSGDDAVRVGRQLAGATDPLQADPGSIRGRYGLPMPMNIGYFKTHIPFWLRVVVFCGALGLLKPGIYSDAFGLAVLIFTYFFQKRRAKRQ